MFFFFLATPYYYFLGAEHYIPKADPAWGYLMPNSPEAWFFFALAFVFLFLGAVLLMLLVLNRPDVVQKGIHPT